MDKKDESIRKYLNARAEFLGAIRLPNDTFKGMAGTEVTSDIIFLKKRDSVIERDDEWVHLAEDENGLVYNKYFVDRSIDQLIYHNHAADMPKAALHHHKLQ